MFLSESFIDSALLCCVFKKKKLYQEFRLSQQTSDFFQYLRNQNQNIIKPMKTAIKYKDN
jgi:hypothetical protein